MKRSVLGLMVLSMLYSSCQEQAAKSSGDEKKASSANAPIRVETMVVSSGMMDHAQTYVGIVEECEATAVSFTGMGVVKRMLVSEGQTISRGQLIAEMDDTQARNVLAGAKAQMAQANDALTRYKMLYDDGSLPEVKWVEIQSKVAQAKSQLDVAKKNLADCRLAAPVSGIIGKKQVGAGETALPSQAVVTILDISTVKVKVSVPEAEIGGIDASTHTSVKVEAVGGNYQGSRIEKGVEADALTHTYDIRIHVPNDGRKPMPGMVASVIFTPEKSHATGSMMIPVTTVQKMATSTSHQSDGSLFVWTVDRQHTVHRTKVTIGHTEGNYVLITDGLKKGDRIVTEGYQKLSEGTKVIY